jgi:hypothetical protein
MPESIFSLKRVKKQIKCLLRSLILNSFRDVALKTTRVFVYGFELPIISHTGSFIWIVTIPKYEIEF